jgi:chromosome partitioning protein
MAVVTVMNQKGGVGKTTTTMNLAAALQERGWRVLAVDFDPQGSLTTCCGLTDPSVVAARPTIADALLTTVHGPFARRATARDAVVATPAGLEILPANQQLSMAETALHTVYGREYALRDTLAGICGEYDLILIDSVPTLGLLAVNALAAAEGLIIPVQAEYLAVHGLAQLLDSVALVRERLNPSLKILGILLTMVDGRTRHGREIVAAVRETLTGRIPVFQVQIPVQIKLKDAARMGMSVLAFDPNGRASQAYRDLATEVIERLESTIPVASANRKSGVGDGGDSARERGEGVICLAARLAAGSQARTPGRESAAAGSGREPAGLPVTRQPAAWLADRMGDAAPLGTEERRENPPGGEGAESRGTGFDGPSGADSGATDAGRGDSARNGSVLKRMGRVLSWPI